ncbi:MAG: dihydroorotase, partial [Flavobacteriaceae bacterium]|nr:dihydroorotase [Flavobacteriaceae bacterium]
EHKNTEFDHAYFGSIGLESCFGALCKLVGTEAAVLYLTRLKKVFNLPESSIEEEAKAHLTLFDPDKAFTFAQEHILSTSHNSAFLGQQLKGKAYGICANQIVVINA